MNDILTLLFGKDVPRPDKIRKEIGDFISYKEVLDFSPTSVWNINGRTNEMKDLFIDDVEKHTCKRNDEKFATSIKMNYSVFNPSLGINILKIWSHVDDWVIDPFAGRDRALIANYMNRHYIGYEISPRTYKQISDKVKSWKQLKPEYHCQIKLADGTKVKENRKFHFCYSCPPYWFREKYESVPGQISDIATREEWKQVIYRTATHLQHILHDEAYAVFIIADIRHKGKMIPLHSDWIVEFERAGFMIKDIIINRTNPMTSAGINGYLKNRIMQKTHEYILVFQNKFIKD